MNEDTSPRVKLPGDITRKPVTPGANSWAQPQARAEPVASDHGSPCPTNRERFENKPMPKLPDEVTSEGHALQGMPYIQPAIPLLFPTSQPKGRAVTDPIPPKALFAGRKPSVSQLSKKFGHLKQISVDNKRLSPTFPYPTGKAAEVLGVQSEQPTRRNAAPSPHLLLADSSNEAKSLSDVQIYQVSDSTHQHSSNSVASDHLMRTDSQDTIGAKTKSQNPHDAIAPGGAVEEPDMSSHDYHLHKTGHLTPPRIANYGRVGETGVLQGQGMIRVESVQGIIEDAASYTNSESTPINDTQRYSQSDFLQPISYSPNTYAGVWENDPAVGYSLPPFSPMPKGFTQKQVKEHYVRSQNSNVTTPSVLGDDYANASFSSTGFQPRQSDGFVKYQPLRPIEVRPPLGSANSWAQETSSTSENGAGSARRPSYWPHRLNPVPSPPHSQRDYDRPGSVAAGLSQLDITIHHHIDTAFASLSRLITDKHDRVMDQMLRRVDNIEDTLSKNNKNLKSEVKTLSSEVGRIKLAMSSLSNCNENVKTLMQNFQDKFELFEKRLGEIQGLCQQLITAQAITDSGSGRRTQASGHHRAESAHGSLGISRDHQQQRSGESRAASRVRTSKGSSRSHRSNTVSSQPASQINDSQGVRREYYTEARAGRSLAPDLRNHPAYAGIPQPATHMYDQHGVPIEIAYSGAPYSTQNLGDGGWYQQAYGSN